MTTSRRRHNIVAGSLVAGLCLAVPVGASTAQATTSSSSAKASASAAKTSSKAAKVSAKASAKASRAASKQARAAAKASKKATKAPKPTTSATPTTPSSSPSASASATPSSVGTPTPSQSAATTSLPLQILKDHLDSAVTISAQSGDATSASVTTNYSGARPGGATVEISTSTYKERSSFADSCTTVARCTRVDDYHGGTFYYWGYPEGHGGEAKFIRADGDIVSVTGTATADDALTVGGVPISGGFDNLAVDSRWDQVAATLPASEADPVAPVVTVDPQAAAVPMSQQQATAEAVLRANLPEGYSVTSIDTSKAYQVALTITNGTRTATYTLGWGKSSWNRFTPDCSYGNCTTTDFDGGVVTNVGGGMYQDGDWNYVDKRADGTTLLLSITSTDGGSMLTVPSATQQAVFSDSRLASLLAGAPLAEPTA